MSSTRTVRFRSAPLAITLLAGNALPEPEDAERRRACEEAYERGFDEASNFLNNQILEQRSHLAHLQEATLTSLAGQSAALAAQASRLLPELALEITRRVLAGFEPDVETIRRVTEETLAEISPGSANVEVHLCPRDFELVRGLKEEFAHRYPGVELFADPDLAPGDCRAKSRFGEIDGRISTKLRNIGRSLA